MLAVRMIERVGSNAWGTGTPFAVLAVPLPCCGGTGFAATASLAPNATGPGAPTTAPGLLAVVPAVEHAARRRTAGRTHNSRFITHLPSPGMPGRQVDVAWAPLVPGATSAARTGPPRRRRSSR